MPEDDISTMQRERILRNIPCWRNNWNIVQSLFLRIISRNW